MFPSCQIIIRELCSLLKLCYSIHNSIPICKRGVVAAYTSHNTHAALRHAATSPNLYNDVILLSVLT